MKVPKYVQELVELGRLRPAPLDEQANESEKNENVEIHYGDNHDERVEKEGSYLPYLYTHGCFDDDGNACCVDIRVSTTSYGTLSLDKMERFMQEMQEGVDTAKYIGETFIKPMVEGKWNWEVTV